MGFPNTSILDNFNRADQGPPLSINWTDFFGDSGGWKVSSNTAVMGSGVNNGSEYWNPNIFGPDCEAYFTVTTKPTSTKALRILARIQTSLPSIFPGDPDMYWVELKPAVGTDVVNITRYFGGTPTILTAINQEFSTGDALGISVIGSTITAWYKASGGSWVSIGTGIDTTLTSAGYIGINADADLTAVLDDFGGGSINVFRKTESTIGTRIGSRQVTL